MRCYSQVYKTSNRAFVRCLQRSTPSPTIAALVLFFLPWIDISCQSKTIATQSGFQMLRGDYTSIPQKFQHKKETLDEQGRKTGGSEMSIETKRSNLDEHAKATQSPGATWAIFGSFSLLAVGALCCVLQWFIRKPGIRLMSLLLPCLAACFFAIQLARGSPGQSAFQAYKESTQQPDVSSEGKTPQELVELGVAKMWSDAIKDMALYVRWPLYAVGGAFSWRSACKTDPPRRGKWSHTGVCLMTTGHGRCLLFLSCR